jgi:hypothetical protein
MWATLHMTVGHICVSVLIAWRHDVRDLARPGTVYTGVSASFRRHRFSRIAAATAATSTAFSPPAHQSAASIGAQRVTRS